jgi:creatinine amidohydrolase/Fe(II)-dependent formamide hydrolase-like protein
MPTGVTAFPLNYWDGMTAEETKEFLTLETGLHANEAETSAVLAINKDLVDMDRANAEMPNFPGDAR